jgi:AcrR family transcriptional regulator
MTSNPMMLDAAHRLVRRNGATNVEQVGSALGEADSEEIDEDDVREALASLPQIRWLDTERVWFWVGDRDGNRVLFVIEKIVSVARSIEIETLCEGVRRAPALRDWNMPNDIVGRLCEDSSLCHREGSKLTATPVVRHWRALLGRSEAAVVAILHAHGPSLARHELERHAAEHATLHLDGLTMCLLHSPVIEQLDAHVFRLRGMPEGSLDEATNGDRAKSTSSARTDRARRSHRRRRRNRHRRSAARRPAEAPAHPELVQPILPRGRHGIPREAVAENQRARLLDGIVAVVAERGYSEATIADAVAIARVSRKTFYELFADKEACFAAACERWLGRLMTATRTAFDSSANGSWCERAQLALGALLRQLAADPVAARAFVVESAGAGSAAIARRDIAIRELAELVDLGRSASAYQPPGITAQVLVGGLEELIRSRILHGATAQLPSLLPDLLFCLIQPLLGTKAATVQRERARRLLERGDERPAPA